MRAARAANRVGDARGVHEALEQELGSDSDLDDEEDVYSRALRQTVNAALATQLPASFTGTAHRLG